MKYKTAVGGMMELLNYNDEAIEKFDELAVYLREITLSERREILTLLMWNFRFGMSQSDNERFDQFFRELEEKAG